MDLSPGSRTDPLIAFAGVMICRIRAGNISVSKRDRRSALPRKAAEAQPPFAGDSGQHSSVVCSFREIVFVVMTPAPVLAPLFVVQPFPVRVVAMRVHVPVAV